MDTPMGTRGRHDTLRQQRGSLEVLATVLQHEVITRLTGLPTYNDVIP